ncbi:MAG: ferrous iron transport protein [Clostridiales bacterium]|jgi:ferrous iron transport protein A|nr:iron transporter FeoA [Oscillospiraceae bacterium]MDN5378761.1 ferrous iron transport protein [Clostridiales bacterium]
MGELTLNDIKTGSSAVVTKIGSLGPLKRRLVDMGITPGVRIFVKKVAPLGDPIEIKLRGYELSIRRSEAKNIFVKKIIHK